MSGEVDDLTILLRRGANKPRIEDESRHEAQAREILGSDWLAARVAAAADAWDEGAIWAGAIRLNGIVSHANPYRAALSVPTEAEGTS